MQICKKCKYHCNYNVWRHSGQKTKGIPMFLPRMLPNVIITLVFAFFAGLHFFFVFWSQTFAAVKFKSADCPSDSRPSIDKAYYKGFPYGLPPN